VGLLSRAFRKANVSRPRYDRFAVGDIIRRRGTYQAPLARLGPRRHRPGVERQQADVPERRGVGLSLSSLAT